MPRFCQEAFGCDCGEELARLQDENEQLRLFKASIESATLLLRPDIADHLLGRSHYPKILNTGG